MFKLNISYFPLKFFIEIISPINHKKLNYMRGIKFESNPIISGNPKRKHPLKRYAQRLGMKTGIKRIVSENL